MTANTMNAKHMPPGLAIQAVGEPWESLEEHGSQQRATAAATAEIGCLDGAFRSSLAAEVRLRHAVNAKAYVGNIYKWHVCPGSYNLGGGGRGEGKG